MLFAERRAVRREAIFVCGTPSLCSRLGTVQCQGGLVKVSEGLPCGGLEWTSSPKAGTEGKGKASWDRGPASR